MCPHISRSETQVPDTALYLVARSPQPYRFHFLAFIFWYGGIIQGAETPFRRGLTLRNGCKQRQEQHMEL